MILSFKINFSPSQTDLNMTIFCQTKIRISQATRSIIKLILTSGKNHHVIGHDLQSLRSVTMRIDRTFFVCFAARIGLDQLPIGNDEDLKALPIDSLLIFISYRYEKVVISCEK